MNPEKKFVEDTVNHGTAWGYQQGCREECCRKPHRERLARQRAARIELGKKHPEWIPHGANGYKNWGCKCDICAEDNAERQRQSRNRKRQEKKNGS